MTTEPTSLPSIMASTLPTIKSNKIFKIRRKKKVLCRGVTACNKHLWSAVLITFFLVQLSSTVSGLMESTEMTVSQSTLVVRRENATTEASVKHAGLARNLHISPVVPEDHLKIGGLVQLNISWLHPIEGHPQYGYTVSVTSHNTSETSHCRSYMCDEYNINGTWTLIPPVIFAAEGACSITLGCSYTVNLTSNPFNGKDRLTKNISLTKCVLESKGDKYCSCDNSTLKVPSVYAKVSNNTAIVSWWHNSSKGDDPSVSYYNLSLGAPLIYNNIPLPWANHDEILTVKARGSKAFSRELKTKIIPGIPYHIRVVAVYTDACVGPTAQFSLTVPEEFSPNNQMEWKWIVGILVASCLACLLVFWARGCRPHRRLKQLLAARTAAVRAGGTAALRRQPAWPPFMRGEDW